MNEQLFAEYENNYDIPLCDAIFSQSAYVSINADNLLRKEGNVPEIAKGLIDQELVRFYSAIERWEFKWQTTANSPVEMQGTFNILPVEKVLNASGWDLLQERYSQMKDFTVLDYFYEEAAVGLYLNQPKKGLFYFEFDADPQPLNLNFKDILKC